MTFYQLIREALEQAAGRAPSRISVTVADTDDGGASLTVADDGRLERRDIAEEFEERAQAVVRHGRRRAHRSGTTVTVSLPGYAARS